MAGKIALLMISHVFAISCDFLDKCFFQKSKILDTYFIGNEEKRNEQIDHQKKCELFIDELLKRYNEIGTGNLYNRESLLKTYKQSLQNIKTCDEYDEKIESILKEVKLICNNYREDLKIYKKRLDF